MSELLYSPRGPSVSINVEPTQEIELLKTCKKNVLHRYRAEEAREASAKVDRQAGDGRENNGNWLVQTPQIFLKGVASSNTIQVGSAKTGRLVFVFLHDPAMIN